MKLPEPRFVGLSRLLCHSLAGVAVVATSACTNFSAHKLAPDGKLGTGEHGIPYVMTRPVYTLAITADAKDENKEVFTLTRSDVPNPLERYSLRLDPALLVNGKFELTLGELGNYGESTSTTSNRTVAILQAIASAVIQTRLPGVAAKDEATLLARIETALKKGKDDSDGACEKPVRIEADSRKPRQKAAPAEKPTVGSTISSLIRELRTRARVEVEGLPKEKADKRESELVLERLHYLDTNQRDCFRALVARTENQSAAILKEPEQKYAGAISVAQGAADPTFLTTVNQAVENRDLAELERLSKNSASPLKEVIAAAQSVAKERAVQDDIKTYLKSIFDMSPDVWKARHLAYVEAQLKSKRFEQVFVQGADSAKALQEQVDALEADWTSTLDAVDLAARARKIDDFLSEIRTTTNPDNSATRFAVEEHIQLREERDRLQERLEKRRTEVLAKNKVMELKTAPRPAAPKKVVPRQNVPVRLVNPEFIEASKSLPSDERKDHPEFVLVLKPVRDPTVVPTPAVAASGVTR